MMGGMVINMNDEQLRTLADLQGFLDGIVAMDFTVAEDERYEFISRTVRRFGYGRLKRRPARHPLCDKRRVFERQKRLQ
jgi:hypothetical protein